MSVSLMCDVLFLLLVHHSWGQQCCSPAHWELGKHISGCRGKAASPDHCVLLAQWHLAAQGVSQTPRRALHRSRPLLPHSLPRPKHTCFQCQHFQSTFGSVFTYNITPPPPCPLCCRHTLYELLYIDYEEGNARVTSCSASPPLSTIFREKIYLKQIDVFEGWGLVVRPRNHWLPVK